MDRDELEKFIIEKCDPNLTDLRWILDALSSAGLAVVPVEPTDEMLNAAWVERHEPRATVTAQVSAAIKKGNLL